MPSGIDFDLSHHDSATCTVFKLLGLCEFGLIRSTPEPVRMVRGCRLALNSSWPLRPGLSPSCVKPLA